MESDLSLPAPSQQRYLPHEYDEALNRAVKQDEVSAETKDRDLCEVGANHSEREGPGVCSNNTILLLPTMGRIGLHFVEDRLGRTRHNLLESFENVRVWEFA